MSDLQVVPVNRNVLFMEEKYVIVSSDVWRIAVDVDTKIYEDAIATVRSDLTTVGQQKKELTPVAELKNVGNFLDCLESSLSSFQQLLPRLDRRRGLINLGGTVLKTPFGTAPLADGTIDELK
jgi:hypothetical protein